MLSSSPHQSHNLIGSNQPKKIYLEYDLFICIPIILVCAYMQNVLVLFLLLLPWVLLPAVVELTACLRVADTGGLEED